MDIALLPLAHPRQIARLGASSARWFALHETWRTERASSLLASCPRPAPRVGVGVIVVRDGCVLVGKRRGSHGEDTWALPGGHLEHGEGIEACAARELLEETGLVASALTLGPYTNDVFVAERKHYVTLFVVAQVAEGEPRVMEPEKCAGWAWHRWSSLPTPRFGPLEALVQSGYVPDRGFELLIR